MDNETLQLHIAESIEANQRFMELWRQIPRDIEMCLIHERHSRTKRYELAKAIEEAVREGKRVEVVEKLSGGECDGEL